MRKPLRKIINCVSLYIQVSKIFVRTYGQIRLALLKEATDLSEVTNLAVVWLQARIPLGILSACATANHHNDRSSTALWLTPHMLTLCGQNRQF
jgi:hypothetical protein